MLCLFSEKSPITRTAGTFTQLKMLWVRERRDTKGKREKRQVEREGRRERKRGGNEQLEKEGAATGIVDFFFANARLFTGASGSSREGTDLPWSSPIRV